jgi:hypothetical protein
MQNELQSEAEGFPDFETASYWSPKACGPACVQAAPFHFLRKPTQLYDVIKIGLQHSGYSSRGWIHEGLAEIIRENGLKAVAREFSTGESEWIGLLQQGHIFVASVGDELPTTGQRGGHLIVVHSFTTSCDPVMFCLMDPSEWGCANPCHPLERIGHSFSGRIIEIWK